MNIKIYTFIDVVYSVFQPFLGIEPETSVFAVLLKRTGNREFLEKSKVKNVETLVVF
jgi:hypothetical protein